MSDDPELEKILEKKKAMFGKMKVEEPKDDAVGKWEDLYIKKHGALPTHNAFLLIKAPAPTLWSVSRKQWEYKGKHEDKMLHKCPVGLEYVRYCLSVCQFCKMVQHEGKRTLVCTHDHTLHNAGKKENYEDYRQMVQAVMEDREKEGVTFGGVDLQNWEDEHGKWKDDAV